MRLGHSLKAMLCFFHASRFSDLGKHFLRPLEGSRLRNGVQRGMGDPGTVSSLFLHSDKARTGRLCDMIKLLPTKVTLACQDPRRPAFRQAIKPVSVRGPVHGSAAMKVMDDFTQGQGTPPEEQGGSSSSRRHSGNLGGPGPEASVSFSRVAKSPVGSFRVHVLLASR